jgi:hypothetical protein
MGCVLARLHDVSGALRVGQRLRTGLAKGWGQWLHHLSSYGGNRGGQGHKLCLGVVLAQGAAEKAGPRVVRGQGARRPTRRSPGGQVQRPLKVAGRCGPWWEGALAACAAP